MNKVFLNFLLKYISLLPDNIFKFFLLNKNLIKNHFIFDTIEYRFEHKGYNFIYFSLPLIGSIIQVSRDILKFIEKNEIISVVSVLTFYEVEKNIQFTHSLLDSNKLYSLDNFSEWSTNLLFNIIEKLELYNSFKKISITITVKKIESI